MFSNTSPVKNYDGLGKASNNFQLLRFLTALTVAATHCLWVIYGEFPQAQWPLDILMQISHCGICIFFGLSGYLITASLIKRPNLLRYSVSRLLRLCPLLCLVAILTAFVLGPLISSASFAHYYSDWRLWAYVPATTLAYPDMTLPGVFTTLPDANEVNISIWTLRYELTAYGIMGLIAGLGLLTSRFLWVWVMLALVGYGAVSFTTNLRTEIAFIDHGSRFGFAFLIGLILFRFQNKIPLNLLGVSLVIGLAVATNHSPYMEPFRILALTYTAIWFGLKPKGFIRAYNNVGDYSYGIFVFHWPIAQTILQLQPEITYLELVYTALPLSLGLAVITWHGVEAPFLRSKTQIANWVKRQAIAFKQFVQQGIYVMGTYHLLAEEEEESRNLPPSPPPLPAPAYQPVRPSPYQR